MSYVLAYKASNENRVINGISASPCLENNQRTLLMTYSTEIRFLKFPAFPKSAPQVADQDFNIRAWRGTIVHLDYNTKSLRTLGDGALHI